MPYNNAFQRTQGVAMFRAWLLRMLGSATTNKAVRSLIG